MQQLLKVQGYSHRCCCCLAGMRRCKTTVLMGLMLSKGECTWISCRAGYTWLTNKSVGMLTGLTYCLVLQVPGTSHSTGACSAPGNKAGKYIPVLCAAHLRVLPLCSNITLLLEASNMVHVPASSRACLPHMLPAGERDALQRLNSPSSLKPFFV